MAPGSILHYINLPSTSYFWRYLVCNLYFPIYIIKILKIFILFSLSDLTFVSDREGIDNPFVALVASSLFVCVGSWDLLRSLLLDWYLGSQKLREILTLLYYITLSSSRENQRSAQGVEPNTIMQVPLAVHIWWTCGMHATHWKLFHVPTCAWFVGWLFRLLRYPGKIDMALKQF